MVLVVKMVLIEQFHLNKTQNDWIAGKIMTNKYVQAIEILLLFKSVTK